MICAFAMKNVEGMEEQSQSKLTMRVLSLQLHVIKLKLEGKNKKNTKK